MRKATYLLLVMMLLASSIAACGSTPEPVTIIETVTVEKEVPVTVEVEKEVPVEVTRIVEVPSGAAEPAQAEATGPVTLEVFNPVGPTNVTEVYAPRLDTLEGKKICMLSNDSWQAQRTLPVLEELLENEFPTAELIPFTEFPRGTVVEQQATADLVAEMGCDAVIMGNYA